MSQLRWIASLGVTPVAIFYIYIRR